MTRFGKLIWSVIMSLDGFIAGPNMDAGLIDEIIVFLAPILLGDGVRFFSQSNGVPINLETINISQSGQVADLHFRVRKPDS